MKKKMAIVIERGTMRVAKRKPAEEGRPLSNLIEDALVQYLNKQSAIPEERKRAFRLFCEQPMKVPSGQLRYVLDEDGMNQ